MKNRKLVHILAILAVILMLIIMVVDHLKLNSLQLQLSTFQSNLSTTESAVAKISNDIDTIDRNTSRTSYYMRDLQTHNHIYDYTTGMLQRLSARRAEDDIGITQWFTVEVTSDAFKSVYECTLTKDGWLEFIRDYPYEGVVRNLRFEQWITPDECPFEFSDEVVNFLEKKQKTFSSWANIENKESMYCSVGNGTFVLYFWEDDPRTLHLKLYNPGSKETAEMDVKGAYHPKVLVGTEGNYLTFYYNAETYLIRDDFSVYRFELCNPESEAFT